MKTMTAPFLIRRARAADMDAVHRLSQQLQASDRRLRTSRLPHALCRAATSRDYAATAPGAAAHVSSSPSRPPA
jgi:hypothetical protein